MKRAALSRLAALAILPFLVGAAPTPAPSAAELRATIAKLVSFGTRHTLSSATDPKRGIGAARSWAAGRFREISAGCGNCLAVETVGDRFTGSRAPNGVRVEDVLAVQRGTADPSRVIVLSAHIDSRVTDVMNATGDAPGANDDGSGVALVIEAARLLSREKFPATIVYALLSGEEQGLWGGELLARTAGARGWKVAGALNNDIVGNTHGQGGEHVDRLVRVFSEGLPATASAEDARRIRQIGAEDDSPSRALARLVRRTATGSGLEVVAVRRPDRFGRGGDQLPMQQAGYPAVRISEYAENYDRQHQDLRTEGGKRFGDTIDGVDFAYLARVTAVNVAAARELARAPAAPEAVTIAGALAPDTLVRWNAVPGAARYRVRWRRADAADWQQHRDVTGTEIKLAGINIDNTLFGVSAVAADGAESLVTFATAAPRP